MRPSVHAEKYGCPHCLPKSTSVTLAVDEKTLPMATIMGRTDRQTDRRTDRVRRNMRPPPREEGRIKTNFKEDVMAFEACKPVCVKLIVKGSALSR